MNVLLLGNGLDLYYNLPTKYSNFLHITNYLLTHQAFDIKNIGDVLSQEILQASDPFIAKCYATHKNVFDNTPVAIESIDELVSLVKHNKWFAFLLNSVDKDSGWIDFEKEIAFVISCFQRILPEKGICFLYKNNSDIKHVVESFGFLVDRAATRKSFMIGAQYINKEFCDEHPIGSDNWVVNKSKVASYLVKELDNLALALKLYLNCFIESTYALLCNSKACNRIPIFANINQVVTFNYTSTYERIYLHTNALHIHGSIPRDIVLGINPDEFDALESVDTSFIAFKKYFQRTLLETDYDYLRWISEVKSTKQTYRLIVMGHSLDITDKDILLDLFQHANEIIILYHNNNAKANYISNLIKLYGKDGFDALQKNQQLTFLALNTDLTVLAQKMQDEAFSRLTDNIGEKIVAV